MKNAKTTHARVLPALVGILLLLATLVACSASSDPWDAAIYTEDTSHGEGALTYTLLVTMEEHSVRLTVSTDEKNLARALLQTGIVEGDDGEFGLYIKRVNGILADYDVNGAYWGIWVDGVATSTGADGITVEDGKTYELRYSK